MRVMHLIGGKESAGSKSHLLPLLKEMKHHAEISLCVFEWGEIPEEASRAGIHVHFLRQKSRYDVSALRRLKNRIKDHGIDLLHTHGPRANLYGMWLKNLVSIRWYTTVHSDPFLDFMGRGLRGKAFTALNVRALKKVDHCFAISKRFAEKMADLGLAQEKITPVYNGISFGEGPDTSSEKIDETPFTILTVGRLHPVKGHRSLIRAFQRALRKTNQDVQLLLVGDGELRKKLEDDVRMLGLSNHVHFLGFREDVETFYKKADLYVQSSLSESFPIVLLEAAKAGVPVVSTDVGGVRELIKDRDHGWVVPVNDEDRLAEAMVEAISSSVDQLKEKGSRLYEHAARNYSLDHLVRVILDGYQKPIQERQGTKSHREGRVGLFRTTK